MKIGSNDIVDVKTGSTQVNKVYLGSNLVWQSFVGLLDSYPNAAAAYSLRRLRTNYSGSAIRVRRTDNTEQDIGFVNNELDTVSLLSFVGSGDGFVATWYDQSGNGNDVSISSASNQPSIVSSGSLVLLSGKPSVISSGNKVLQTSSSSVPVTAADGSSSCFSVLSSTNSSFGLAVSYIDGGSNLGYPIGVNSTQLRILRLGGAADDTVSYTSGSNSIAVSILNTTSAEIWNNNSSDGGTVASSVTSGTTEVSIFARRQDVFSFVGKISETIIYPKDSTTDRSAIETNINNFYSIY